MSTIEKLKKKLNSKPIRNDMTIDEIKRLALHYGCVCHSGGKHPLIIADKQSGTVIPIPGHGSIVKEAYVKQVKDLFDTIILREKNGEDK